MKKLISIIVSVIVLLGLGGWYLVIEADASEPGDFLYPVDLATESIERLITFNDIASSEFELDILDERVEELEVLIDKDTLDEELILGATEKVGDQRARVQVQIEKGEGNASEAMQQVQNRYKVQVEEHMKVMEKVQTKVEGKDAQLKVEQTVSGYENSLDKGNSDSSTGNESSDKGNSDSSTGNESSGRGN